VRGQSPTERITPSDLATVCQSYGGAEVVVVGRAEQPVTFHISGEAAIETARQNLVATETEVARLRASLDERIRMEREAEFSVSIVNAQDELAMRRAMDPPPLGWTLIPVVVERAFHGAAEPTLMLRRINSATQIEPGELYLISGSRSKNLIPLFPEMGDLGGIEEYVETTRVASVASVQKELRILESATPGATVIGTLQMHSYGDVAGATLRGVRMIVSTGPHLLEALTADDGSFVVSGVEPGHVEVMPFLPENLTVINRSALTFELREGGCSTLHLTAGLNGRVRGQIVSATGGSLEGVELGLYGMDPAGRLFGSHNPHTTVRPNSDGTFEFFGQPPGTYVLSAGIEIVENGKRRSLTTYFPGTRDLADAIPIVIGNATQHDGFDFAVATK